MMTHSGLFRIEGVARCFWCAGHDDYIAYHDREWGFPVLDDTRLFEKLCLEGFQSGLSWLTILRKRDAFRRGFAGFDPEKLARFGPKDVTRLLGDAGIVRHRGKIESAIANARRACALAEEHGSIAAYVWRYEPPPDSRPRRITRTSLAKIGTCAEAVALSKDLKRRGFTFVGPTTVYAFMQAMGMVNDHLEGCATRPPALLARAAMKVVSSPARPGSSAPPIASSGPRRPTSRD
jgi:DNA-3-methyladenine glycosylase I